MAEGIEAKAEVAKAEAMVLAVEAALAVPVAAEDFKADNTYFFGFCLISANYFFGFCPFSANYFFGFCLFLANYLFGFCPCLT